MNPEARKAGDGKRSTTWARSRPMRPASPTRLKKVGYWFPAAFTRWASPRPAASGWRRA